MVTETTGNMEKYRALVHTKTKQYVTIIRDKDNFVPVFSELPSFFNRDTTLLSLQEEYPGVILENVALIEITVERKGFAQQLDLLGAGKKPFTFPERITPCLICGTNSPNPAMLLPVAESVAGSVAQAVCVHVQCITDNAAYYEEAGIIAAIVPKDE